MEVYNPNEPHKCAMCDTEGQTVAHHLSYDPELIVFLCRSHHIMVHRYAEIAPEKRVLLDEWVVGFGNQWNNGRKKFYQSEWHKEYLRSYQKKNRDRIRVMIERWRKEHPEFSKENYNRIINDPIRHQKELDRKNKWQRERRKDPEVREKNNLYKRERYKKVMGMVNAINS